MNLGKLDPVRSSALISVVDVVGQRVVLLQGARACSGSRGGGCRAWRCRSSPGSMRGRAGRGCRRPAGRCCRAAAAGSPPRGSSARRSCAASSRPRSRSPPVRSGPECRHQRLGHLQERLARRAADLLDHLGRVAGVSAAGGSGRRSAGPAASGRCRRRPGQLARPGAERLRVVLDGLRLVLGLVARLGVVPPALRVVGAALGVEAGEEAVEVLGVLDSPR